MTLKKLLPLLAVLALALCSFEVQAGVEGFRQVKTQVAAPAVNTDSRVKSYREWKSEKVQEALVKVTSTKTQIELAKSKDPNMAHRKSATEAVSGVSLEKLEDQLSTDQNALDLARDLSVTDYFAGYLSKLPDKKAAFSEVAGKLTPDEVAELMAAYANSVFGTHAADMPPSAISVSAEHIR